ncbi:hypothetical protein KCU78_g6621, partial [Aureobasidium melanogenum]
MATKTTKNELSPNMDKTTKNKSWPSWIIGTSMKLLPWLMLLHNLSYIVFPSSDNSKTDNKLAWANFLDVLYLIGMQAWIDGGIIEV